MELLSNVARCALIKRVETEVNALWKRHSISAGEYEYQWRIEEDFCTYKDVARTCQYGIAAIVSFLVACAVGGKGVDWYGWLPFLFASLFFMHNCFRFVKIVKRKDRERGDVMRETEFQIENRPMRQRHRALKHSLSLLWQRERELFTFRDEVQSGIREQDPERERRLRTLVQQSAVRLERIALRHDQAFGRMTDLFDGNPLKVPENALLTDLLDVLEEPIDEEEFGMRDAIQVELDVQFELVDLDDRNHPLARKIAEAAEAAEHVVELTEPVESPA